MKLHQTTVATALLLSAVCGGAARASIIYDNPAGVTTQPNNDLRWNATGSVGGETGGGGVVIGSSYFLSAGHLGGVGSITLSTIVNGEPDTTTYDVAKDAGNNLVSTAIGGTDLVVYKINGTFPASSIVPLYSGAAGSEKGKTVSFVGFGRYAQGTTLASTVNGQTVNNGYLWGSDTGKNAGSNTVDFVANDAPNRSASLDYTFSPTSGDSIYTNGDSGGGAFIQVNGQYQLAGLAYGISQYYTAPSNDSIVQAAVYNTAGLYVKEANGSFILANTGDDLGDVSQFGVASEIAPYEAQINAITGVPEPTSLSLLTAGGLALLGRRRHRA